ncbi:MAG TPA: FAD-dependent oxidoreductase [Eubacteriales bacterium]|nr:FAD-dependent oxidoreductase [Eubacteriales bacterium]
MIDVAIVGGGVAGLTAAVYALRRGLNVVMFEKLTVGGQTALIDKIENFPSYESVNGFELVNKMYEQATALGLETKYEEIVAIKQADAYINITSTAGEYQTKTVIIATGATHKNLGLGSQYDGKGVHYCATCDGMFYKDKIVAVVGGTNIAMSDALYLSNLAKEVYVIVPQSKLFGQDVIMRTLNKPNVHFMFSSKIDELTGDKKINGITVKNSVTGETTSIAVDGVFVAIGTTPLSGFVSDLVETVDGRIVVDNTMATNKKGIYAAGDVLNKKLKQIVTACADGATAAESAAEYIAKELKK